MQPYFYTQKCIMLIYMRKEINLIGKSLEYKYINIFLLKLYNVHCTYICCCLAMLYFIALMFQRSAILLRFIPTS